MIHKLADVEDPESIHPTTKIWRWTHVQRGAKIGAYCSIGQGCFIAEGAVIGDKCKIQNNVSIFSGVRLGRDVFIGPSVVFTNVRAPRADVDRRDSFECTVVERLVTIGANATIVCPVRIAHKSFVAAGAVVIHDVHSGEIVAGVPAKTIQGDQ